jgi:Cu-Zn family superoxide dismutase
LAEQRNARRAVAIVGGGELDEISGVATFDEIRDGLLIALDLQGAPPGEHAIFVCSGRDCGDPGAHFNPAKAAHGSRRADSHHAGDLGNVFVDANGVGHFEVVCQDLSVHEGTSTVLGRTLVMFERADDFTTQPTGNAGRKLACGSITRRE